MKSNILIPTDFSGNAQNAIYYAVRLFGNESRYILLNTWQTPYTPPEVLISVEDVLMKASKDGLEKELRRIKQTPGFENIVFDTISEMGNVVEVIKPLIEEKNIDFVVMGTQGATGLREALIGSNTASAAKELNCPLIIVPGGAAYTGIKNIVFAADYKELENADALAPMIEIAKENDDEITILNILDQGQITTVEQGAAGIKLDHLLAGVKHTYSFIESNDKAAGIDEYLNTNKPDMLVMVERKTGFFKSIFHKSITKQMAFHAHVPMMVLHGK